MVTSSSRAKSGNSVIIGDEVVRLTGLDLDDRAEAKWQSSFVRSIFFSQFIRHGLLIFSPLIVGAGTVSDRDWQRVSALRGV